MNREQVAADPYRLLPELYDLEHASFGDDINLYLQFAAIIGDPILELGCGTGRILLPLARAGHRVTGLDRSAAMLDRARDVLQGESAALVTLVEAEMTAADSAPGGPFGLVIFSLNGLMHLPTVAEQRQALEAARRALDPRGMLVVDLMSPGLELLSSFDGRVQHEGSWVREDGVTVDRFAARTHSPTEQRIETDLWFDLVASSGTLTRVRSRFALRYLTRAEIELQLELAGYVEWQFYGTYDLDPHDDQSERLIVTAEVTPS